MAVYIYIHILDVRLIDFFSFSLNSKMIHSYGGFERTNLVHQTGKTCFLRYSCTDLHWSLTWLTTCGSPGEKKIYDTFAIVYTYIPTRFCYAATFAFPSSGFDDHFVFWISLQLALQPLRRTLSNTQNTFCNYTYLYEVGRSIVKPYYSNGVRKLDGSQITACLNNTKKREFRLIFECSFVFYLAHSGFMTEQTLRACLPARVSQRVNQISG